MTRFSLYRSICHIAASIGAVLLAVPAWATATADYLDRITPQKSQLRHLENRVVEQAQHLASSPEVSSLGYAGMILALFIAMIVGLFIVFMLTRRH